MTATGVDVSVTFSVRHTLAQPTWPVMAEQSDAQLDLGVVM